MAEQPNSESRQRRVVGAPDVLVIVTLMIQLGAFVWGAATLNASVSALQTSTASVEATLARVTDQVVSLDRRVTVIEDREQRGKRP